MATWSPTTIMSNLASSLSSSLRRMPKEDRLRDQLIRDALLSDEMDDEESNDSHSRSESPEIPMLDSPSVFKVASNGDENRDPNIMAKRTRSRLSLGDTNQMKLKESAPARTRQSLGGLDNLRLNLKEPTQGSSSESPRRGLRSRQRKSDSQPSQDEGRPPIKMKIKLNNINESQTTDRAVVRLQRLSISKNTVRESSMQKRRASNVKEPLRRNTPTKHISNDITPVKQSPRLRKNNAEESLKKNDHKQNSSKKYESPLRSSKEIKSKYDTKKHETYSPSSILQSPSKNGSVIKRRSSYVRKITYDDPEQNSLDTPSKRPIRKAASKGMKSKYTESPEKLDISSDDGGSDNYDSVKHSSSSESSDTGDSDDLDENEDENIETSKTSKRFTLKKSENKKLCRSDKAKQNNSAIKKKQMTPRIPSRKIPLPNVVSPLQEAQMRLHVAAVPQDLPCREEEFYEILAFTEGKIVDGTGGCMYISGLPGTGKTATVKEVIRTLKGQSETEEIPEFDFIEINGMRLTEPNQAYPQIWKALTGERVAVEQARTLLEKRFSSEESTNNEIKTPKRKESLQRKTIVLLVDELDMLWNRKQTVLYNIFEWPVNKSAKLVVLAIANTMDLPERVMINRVSSRMGLTRLTFSPYTHQQLSEIVASRLSGLKVFNKDAVQLVARKVSSLSGDARRALDICRRATEIAQREHANIKKNKAENYETSKVKKSPKKSIPKSVDEEEFMVGMNHVTQAHKEMFCSPKIMAIRCCSQFEKFFLQTLITIFQKTGIEETTFDRTIQLTTELALVEGHSQLTLHELSGIVNRLSSMKLLLAEPGKSGRLDMKIRLNVSQDDVLFALKKGNDEDGYP